LLQQIDAGTDVLRHLGGGTEAHRKLCSIATYFLILGLGKRADDLVVGGASACAYVAGNADVGLRDGSLFVECGTLRFDKLYRAMKHSVALAVVPYRLGYIAPLAPDVLERLKIDLRGPYIPSQEDTNPEWQRYARDVHDLMRYAPGGFMYIFQPVDVPQEPIEDRFAQTRAMLTTMMKKR
jgi:hypothetical protein